MSKATKHQRRIAPKSPLRMTSADLIDATWGLGILAMLRACGPTGIIIRAILQTNNAPPQQQDFGPEGAD